MFTEELSGNVNRKRQEQLKARRIELQRHKVQENVSVDAQKSNNLKQEHGSIALPTSSSSVLVSSSTSSTTTCVAFTTDPNTATATATSITTFSVVSSHSSSSTNPREEKKLTIMEQVFHSRQIRLQGQEQNMFVTKIQAYFRAYKTYMNQILHNETCLQKRISDLRTVQQSLKVSNTNIDYAPPPAMVTPLVRQLLFLMHTRPRRREMKKTTTTTKEAPMEYKIGNHSTITETYQSQLKNPFSNQDMKLITGVLQQALLPGIQLALNNSHLNPLLPWIDTLDGRLRLVKLLRLILVCMMYRQQDVVSNKIKKDKNIKIHSSSIHEVVATPFLAHPNQIHILLVFLQHVLGVVGDTEGNENRSKVDSDFQRVIDFCSTILLDPTLDRTSLQINEITSWKIRSLLKQQQTNPWIDQDKSKFQPRPLKNSTHRVTENYHSMDLIRFTRSTLLYSSGSPIPSNAEMLREGSISLQDRERYSVLVDFVLRVVARQSHPFLYIRILTELWTIPLFTWKVYPNVLEHFLRDGKISGIPYFIQLIDTVLHTYSIPLFHEDRSLLNILPELDIPLNRCPSPSSVSLLSTLAYFGPLFTNGSRNVSTTSVDASCIFFNFLALLLNCVPVGTFTTRQSSVDWLCEGSHLTPVVLNPVILDQCKTFLSDRYVRSLFSCAIFHTALDANLILTKKDQHDLELEKETAEILSLSASSLASKDATLPDRSKSIFLGSEWAKKLTRGVASLFKNTVDESKGDTSKAVGSGRLIDTSFVSRQLAHGTHRSSVPSVSLPQEEERDPGPGPIVPRLDFLFSLCRVYGAIISRWGGLGGNQRLLSIFISKPSPNKSNGSNVAFFTDSCEPCVMNLLNVLCFSTDLIIALWALIQSNDRLIHDIHDIAGKNKNAVPLLCLSIISPLVHGTTSPALHFSNANLAPIVLLMFASCFSHILIISDDMNLPIPRHQILRSVLLFKRLVFRLCRKDVTEEPSEDKTLTPNYLGVSLMGYVLKCLRDLYDKSSRRPICAPKLFTVDDILEKEIKTCKTYEDFVSLLNDPILRLAPYLVPFKRRLVLFNGLITYNRIAFQGDPRSHDVRPGQIVNVNRARLMEDGLATMNRLGRNLRQRIIVRYYSDAIAEVGFDAGGLFKEFWVDLCVIAFDPNFGLFCTSDGSSDVLYPNASAKVIHGLDGSLELFGFLGRVLGKALYEGITIQPQFAHFFLSFLRGDYNYLHMLPDLSTVDPVLYNNLMFLKAYDGDARELCLSFTVVNTDLGNREEIELIPNGSQIDVTNENKNRYIAMVAKYHIHDKLKEQSEAFTRGLWDVIEKKWLLLFNEPELQVLISGAFDGTIDVDDLKANTIYIGALSDLDPVIHRFWKVVYSLSPSQIRSLLRFVTSCARPPSLGFSCLEPKFTIQRVDGGDAMLPTASTCFNILKLPSYSSTKILREKLLLALGEGSVGFHLA